MNDNKLTQKEHQTATPKVAGMILAAGLGTRLAPITDNLPKALIEVQGMPMLERVLRQFKTAGVDRVVINMHHHAWQIFKFVTDIKHRFGDETEILFPEIVLSDERHKLCDTGGGIAGSYWFVRNHDCLLVQNADILSDIDHGEMIKRHLASGADVTLLTDGRKSSRYLYFDSENKLAGWKNTKTGETRPDGFDPDALVAAGKLRRRAFAGIHVLSPEVVEDLYFFSQSETPVFSIIDFYIDRCQTIDIRCYEPTERYQWFDIGSVEKLATARSEFKQNQ